jgi:hypothetical protein
MPSKFLVPFEVPDFQGTPSSTADAGYVLLFIKEGWLTSMQPNGTQTDLVLRRPLDNFSQSITAEPVTPQDTVLSAIEKIQKTLSNIRLTGDVTGIGGYDNGQLIIETTGGGGIDCTELLNCEVIIDIQDDLNTLELTVQGHSLSIDLITDELAELGPFVQSIEQTTIGLQNQIDAQVGEIMALDTRLIQVEGDTLSLDTRVTSLENAGPSALSATELDSYHFSGYGTQYEQGDLIYYQNGVYLCVATNDGVTPNVGGNNSYWNYVGLGYRVRQILSDWNATTGEAQILNKPTLLSQFTNDAGYITGYTETDPVFAASVAASITSADVSYWNEAYGWGNHALAGYLLSEEDTLDAVTSRGNKTQNGVEINGNVLLVTGLGTTNTVRIGHTDTPVAFVDIRPSYAGPGIGLYVQNPGVTGDSYTITAQAQQNNAATNNIAGYFNAQYGATNTALRTDYGNNLLNALGGNLLVGTTTDAGYKLDVNGTARVIDGALLSDYAGVNTSWSLLATTGGNSNTNVFGVKNGAMYTAGTFYMFDNYAQSYYFYTNRGYNFIPANSRGPLTLDWIYAGGTMFVAGGNTNVNNGWVSIKPTFNYNSTPDAGVKFIGLYYSPTNYAGLGTQHYAILAEAGQVQLGNLSGSGTRMVVADANGLLSTQNIPTGNTGTVESVGLTTGSAGNDIGVTGSPITTSGSFTLNIPSASLTARGVVTTGTQTFAGEKTFYSYITKIDSNQGTTVIQGYAQSVLQGAIHFGLFFQFDAYAAATQGFLWKNSSSQNILALAQSGEMTVLNLAGASSRMVVADTTGKLTTQPIPVAYQLMGAMAG